jgi:hypothetical protein
VATVRVPGSDRGPERSRLALGTNRVWLTDDLGLYPGPNTWTTLPHPGGEARDARETWSAREPTYDPDFGVPSPWLGPVVTLAWASTTELLALYERGVVRYTETPGRGPRTRPSAWATRTWPTGRGTAAPATETILTDVAPVPGTNDFYLTATGVGDTDEETVWFYRSADGRFHRTRFRHVLDPPEPGSGLGPRDPAYAVAVDPADPASVYIGTVTGVWRGRRAVDGRHTWTPYLNGLPQAAVQDLHLWVDPTGRAGSPRLLRAGIQSRGIWEVDLAHYPERRTWIRARGDDDRRMPLPDDDDPLRASPDIVVRPRWPATAVPPYPGVLSSDTDTTSREERVPKHDLWTFQTAFRWLYPSVGATGTWTRAMDDLVSLHRTAIGKTPIPRIDNAVWNSVVGTRLTAAGAVSTQAGDRLAVYRAPWHTARAPDATPSEVDFAELVVPLAETDGIWEVHRGPSTVDVLIHHRDGREVAAGGAYAVLMWRSADEPETLTALGPTGVTRYLSSIVAGTPTAVPRGWTVATGPRGAARRAPPVPLEGRMPRGVSIDVDLSTVPAGHHVLFLAFVCSTADDLPLPQPSATATVTELVRSWPHAAARVVKVGRHSI